MKPHDELWRRLEGFRFDGDVGAGHFVRKLARDNGWAESHAGRVVEEYRRYVYLACTAGHVAVPSHPVDLAWHQHLLDTQPYWDEFCQKVLRRPLHHHPARADGDDRRRYVDLYKQTLASYENTFGEAPPPDIWPPAAVRFSSSLKQRSSKGHDGQSAAGAGGGACGGGGSLSDIGDGGGAGDGGGGCGGGGCGGGGCGGG